MDSARRIEIPSESVYVYFRKTRILPLLSFDAPTRFFSYGEASSPGELQTRIETTWQPVVYNHIYKTDYSICRAGLIVK